MVRAGPACAERLPEENKGNQCDIFPTQSLRTPSPLYKCNKLFLRYLFLDFFSPE